MRLLVAEDDTALSGQLRSALRAVNFAVDIAANGEDAQHLGEVEDYDAVILDLGLPEKNGVEVLKNWRRLGRTMPVLILTARDGWSEKVAGFDAGADDYLTKPFHTEELIARLRALIRRSVGQSSSILRCGEIALDSAAGTVSVDGRTIDLTAYEYKLLSYLMHHPNRVHTRSQLIEHIYEQEVDPDSNTVEVFVARLRKKLGVNYIATVRGLGYRLDPPSD